MISSRWPRPIGIMASIALMPVWTGVFTGDAQDHARRDHSTGRVGPRTCDRALAVERLAERVDHATDQLGPDRHRGDAAGPPDLVAFFDLGVRADDHDADRLFFEVQGDAHHVLLGELDQLERADVAQAVDAGDAVADLDDGADLLGRGDLVEVLDLRSNDAVDFVGSDGHGILALEVRPIRPVR